MEPYANGMMFPHFRPINFRDYRSYLPTAYDASLTTYQQMVNVLKFCNEIGVLNQDMANNWNVLLEWVKTNGVDESVTALLNQWVLDGTMATILDKTALKDINDKLDTLQNDIKIDLSGMKTYVNDEILKLQKGNEDFKTEFKKYVDKSDSDLNARIDSLFLNKIADSLASLADIKAKYPTGTQGIVIAQDNNHWYYYNGEWKDGGVYIGNDIPDHSVTAEKLAPNVVTPIIYSMPFNFDTINKRLTYQRGRIVISDNNSTLSAVVFDAGSLELTGNIGWIVFDTINKEFLLNDTPNINQVFCGFYGFPTNTYYMTGNYSVDGKMNDNISEAFKTPLIYGAMEVITDTTPIVKLQFDAGNVMTTTIDNHSARAYVQHTIEVSGIGWIVFDEETNTFKANNTPSKHESVVGSYNTTGRYYAFTGNILYNGYPYYQNTPLYKHEAPIIFAPNKITFDKKAKTLTIGQGTHIGLSRGEIIFNNDGTDPVISLTGTAWLLFDLKLKQIRLGGPSDMDSVTVGYYSSPDNELYMESADVVGGYGSFTIDYLGDSITHGLETKKVYHKYIDEMLKSEGLSVTTINDGLGGTTISEVAGHVEDNFVKRAEKLNLDSDMIVVFGGTNDYGAGAPLGETDSESIREFNGAVNLLLDYLETTYSGQIVGIIPPKRFYKDVDGETANSAGFKLSDYCEVLRTKFEKYGITYYDLQKEIDLNPTIEKNYATNYVDGLHPNSLGHSKIAGLMYPQIKGTALAHKGLIV